MDERTSLGSAARYTPTNRVRVAALFLGMSSACAELAGLGEYQNAPETSGGGPAANGPVAQDRFPAAFASALCEGIVHCCGQAQLTLDVVNCKERHGHIFSGPPPGIEDVFYDASSAADCVALIEQATASCALDRRSFLETCGNVWKGSRPPGAPCEIHAQCSHTFGATTSCAPLTRDGAPVCNERYVHLKAGEACAVTCSELELGPISGTNCGSGAGGTAGSSAGGEAGCGTDGAAGAGTGGAAASGSGGSGAGVRDALGTMSGCFTNDSLYCDCSGRCQQFAPLPIGMPCEPYPRGPGGCVPEAFCDGELCRPRVAPGEVCPMGIECSSGDYCSHSRTCTKKLSNGELCIQDEECQGACAGQCMASTFAVLVCTGDTLLVRP